MESNIPVILENSQRASNYLEASTLEQKNHSRYCAIEIRNFLNKFLRDQSMKNGHLLPQICHEILIVTKFVTDKHCCQDNST